MPMGGAIFAFSAKIGLKNTKNRVFCILCIRAVGIETDFLWSQSRLFRVGLSLGPEPWWSRLVAYNWSRDRVIFVSKIK